MRVESVKGTLLLGAVVTVRRLRDRQVVSTEQLRERLSAGAIEMLDRKIDLAAWYPIGIFCELIDFDWDVAGHGQPSYLERQGSVTADRLFSSGTYQQLEFAERSGKVETVRSLERQSKLISTITCALYSFLTFEVTIQPSALRIVYRNASAFGDALIHTTVGFMNQINHRQGSKRRWSGRRISRDEVQFDMELPARFTEAG